MNEWGIPDWQDASAYPKRHDEWSVKRWRWEFYRRRSDLREYFDRWAQETYEDDIEWYNFCIENDCLHDDRIPRKPHEPGFTAKRKHFPSGHTLTEQDQHPFGYSEVPNPRIGQQPDTLLHWMNDSGINVNKHCSIDEASGKRLMKKVWSLDQLTHEEKCKLDYFLTLQPVHIRKGQTAIVFDLTKPLTPQLKNAKGSLEAAQRNLLGRTLSKRHHRTKWPLYLRVLDAREAAASWAEIAEILPTVTTKTPQTARDIYEQANSMRFNF